MRKPAQEGEAIQVERNISQLLTKTRGQRIKTIRETAGLTQQNLAERAGLSISTISAVERDLYDLRIDSLNRIARVLANSQQTDISELIFIIGAEVEGEHAPSA